MTSYTKDNRNDVANENAATTTSVDGTSSSTVHNSFTSDNFTTDNESDENVPSGVFDNLPPNFTPEGNVVSTVNTNVSTNVNTNVNTNVTGTNNTSRSGNSSVVNAVTSVVNNGSVTSTNNNDSLNADEVEAFWRNGYAGPFALPNPSNQLEELANRYERVVVERSTHPLYGRYSLRDWHLVDNDLESLFVQDVITNKVVSLLGPDLLLWRSKIFYKPPGGDAIGWHQEWGAFDGEEIGNSTPSLQPATNSETPWDLTVWVALDDVTPANGPLQFASGTNTLRVPWVKVPMTQSAFFEEPFEGLTKDEVVNRTRNSELVLDINTSNWLDGVDVNNTTLDALTNYLRGRFDELLAKYTDFTPDPNSVATMVMSRGSFVIFSERTMHGSPPNTSNSRRLAVNCRITRADTLVYPGRLSGNNIDGSNVDISEHVSLLVAGNAVESRNAYRRPKS